MGCVTYKKGVLRTWIDLQFAGGGPEGRARYARARKTLATGLLQKLVTVAIGVVLAPMFLRYLGPVEYGLWMAVTATLNTLGSADLGIGNGLLNEISRAYGLKDRVIAAKAVSTAAILLSFLAAAVVIGVIGFHRVLPWGTLLHLRTEELRADCASIALVVGISVGVSLPLSISGRVQQGYQEGAIFNAWSMLGATLSFAGAIVAVAARQPIPVVVFASIGGPVLASSMSTVHEFTKRRPWLRPRWTLYDSATARTLVKNGSLILAAQIGTTIYSGAGPILLAHKVNYVAVAGFCILQRIFAGATILATSASLPLWPAYAEAAITGDTKWMSHRSGRA